MTFFEGVSERQDPSSGPSARERIIGSIVGAFVGDALGLGCHWEYNVDKFKSKFGEVKDYLKPLDDSFHPGLEAGDVSQTSQVSLFLLEALGEAPECEYEAARFTDKFDELLKTLDGTRFSGRYTQKDVVDVWTRRIQQGKPWGECASPFGDTTDGFLRAAIVFCRYFKTPTKAAEIAKRHVELHFAEPHVVSQAMAFGALVGALVEGVPFDSNVGTYLYQMVRRGQLPFSHALTPEEKAAGKDTRDTEGNLPEPDPVLWPGQIARVASNPAVKIEPASAVAQVYGMPCAFFMVVPGAYYLAARFQSDFEEAVIQAVNGAGQNLARAALVGALCGAIGGVQAIPKRWIDGLRDGPAVLALAEKIASAAVEDLDGTSASDAAGDGRGAGEPKQP